MAPTTPRSDKENVTNFLNEMLGEMESEFSHLSSSIQNRMSEMDKRMEHLERSITELMTDAGLEIEKEESNADMSTSSQSAAPTTTSQKQIHSQPTIL